MKNKLITRFLITVAGIALLTMSAANAFALSNRASVVSPFWQSDSNVYTFVAVSHSSLQDMNSEIGVIMNALKTDGSTSFGSTSFTVGQNTTSRVFIVATNHATINSVTVTGSADIFITGTTNLASGQLNITSGASNPLLQGFIGTGRTLRARDVTMLTYWGAIVVPGTNTGFAMEFIGDTHDSLFGVTTPGRDATLGIAGIQ